MVLGSDLVGQGGPLHHLPCLLLMWGLPAECDSELPAAMGVACCQRPPQWRLSLAPPTLTSGP